MTRRFLPLQPISDGYGVQTKATASKTETEGGRPRIRSRTVGGSRLLNLTWKLPERAFAYLEMFFTHGVNEGGTEFEIDLYTEGGVLKRHVAVFEPGTFSMAGKTGPTVTASAQVDAYVLNPISREDALAAVDFYSAGFSFDGDANPFDALVNEDMAKLSQ